MSFFSIYAGLIYNDVFSKSINIFGSSWYAYQSTEAIVSNEDDMISPAEPKGWYGTPYPFGVDPIWQVILRANNYLVLFFSRKKPQHIFQILNFSFFKRLRRTRSCS